MRYFTTISFLLLMSFLSYSQEICDNGIDDDDDGLIDLQDEDCHCGLGLYVQPSYAISNPNFDNSTCCPTIPQVINWNNLTHTMDCVDDWGCSAQVGNYNALETAYYINSCNSCILWNFTNNAGNFNTPDACFNSSDNGMLGMVFGYQQLVAAYKYDNVASSCLNMPLLPSNNYSLKFKAYNFHGSGSNGQIVAVNDTFHFGLYGNASCASLPMTGYACNLPNWQTTANSSVAVPLDSSWHEASFTFSPSTPINAIGLGEVCGTNIGYSNPNPNSTANNSWKRILIDSLELFYSKIYNLQINEIGSWCDFPYILSASIDTVGGTWQWYKDSVALVGETDSILDITNLGIGNYTILYHLNGDCQGFNLEIGPPVYPYTFLEPVPPPLCSYDSIYFDGFSYITTGTIDQYYYSFGNGDSAYVEDPIYAYNAPGTYSIIHTAESDRGCRTSDTVIININPRPNTDFTVNNGCLYDEIDFISLATVNNGTVDSILWKFGNSAVSPDSSTLYTYANPGNYLVELHAWSNQGCKDSLSQNITIHPVPQANYIVNNDCENISIPFNSTSTISSGTITSYLWRFGDNSTANTPNANHTFSDPGNLTTSLWVMSDSGCVDSIDVPLVVYPEPVAHFTLNSSCFYADFTNTSVIANNGNIVTTNWDFGDANTETDYDVDHFYTADGDYTVTLQVISDNGCINQHDSTITISNNFDASFTILNHLVCADDPVKFTNTSTELFGQEINYLWEASNGQTSTRENPVFTFTNDSDDPIPIEMSLLISTSSGCIDSAFQAPILSVIPAPNADFYFTPNEPTISNSKVQFTNLSLRADRYDWNFGDNNYSTELNPSHVYADHAKGYTVTLTAYDDNEICIDEISKTLIVLDEILFFIPNTFTPDGSGFNDEFLPQFVSGIDIYNFRLQIFNRWGEIVFESRDPSVGWDGQYAGRLIKQDVYLWQIDFEETMDDKVHTHTGTVNVLR